LLEFLNQRGEDVQKLNKRGVTARNVKGKLWNDASIMLRKHNYDYSAKQCATKWKNIKQDCKSFIIKKNSSQNQ